MRPPKAERSPCRASARETTETRTDSMMKPLPAPVKRRARLPFPFGNLRRLGKERTLLATFLGVPVYEQPLGTWGRR